MEPTEAERARRAAYLAARQGQAPRGVDARVAAEAQAMRPMAQTLLPRPFLRLIQRPGLLWASSAVFALSAIGYVLNDSWQKKGVCVSCEAQARVAEKMYGANPMKQFQPRTIRFMDSTQSDRSRNNM